ncbi:MAG: dihydropteroate synthase [Alphaproteobacteria bacterium]|nr:dihydropteroate synthase [Alphaproteobacteria bacterium]
MLPVALPEEARLYLEPLCLSSDDEGGRPLAGGPLHFHRLAIIVRAGGLTHAASAGLAGARRWADRLAPAHGEVFAASLARLSAPRPPVAGLALCRPLLMGILNVTPDSFSDGGEHPTAASAIARAQRLATDGADLLDIGGESTRPGAAAVTAAEEWRRVGPVLRGLDGFGLPLSIDSRHAPVIGQALALGVRIVNDVSGFHHEPLGLALAAGAGAGVVLMHSRGEPHTMRRLAGYRDVALDVYDELSGLLVRAEAAGIARADILLDPGIGFAKTAEQNLELLRHLPLFHALGQPLMLGLSRKSFLAAFSDGAAPKGRLAASLAAALFAAEHGVQVLRVHDVTETRQALAVWRALRFGGGTG